MNRFLQPCRKYYALFNLISFKLVWINSVLFQEQGIAFSLILISINLITSPSLPRDLAFAGIVASTGILIDLTLIHFGLFMFDSAGIPLWLMLLWFSFAHSLNHGLRLLFALPLPLLAPVGACLGCLSYLGGRQLDAVAFGYNTFFTLTLLAVIWSLLLPAARITKRYIYA